jgi:hypothetical protein
MQALSGRADLVPSAKASWETKMALYVYVDNSNVWIEGCRFSAVRRGMAASLLDAQAKGIVDADWRIDFGRLYEAVCPADVAIGRASLFGSRPPANDSLWALARSRGFDVATYDRNFVNKEKEVDVAIAARMTQDAYKYMSADDSAKVVLLSGDRDQTPAIEILKEEGISTLIVFWEHATSPVLREAASDFFPLDKLFDHISLPRDTR